MERNPYGGKQPERLLRYLQDHREITALQGWELLDIYRMSGAVHKLRKRHHLIETKYIKVQNRWGETCVIANYIYTPKEEALKVCCDEATFGHKN